MKKNILLLCLCAVALVGLLFLTKAIHDGMDDYVIKKNPVAAPQQQNEPLFQLSDDTMIEINDTEEEETTVENEDGSTTTTKPDGTTVTTNPDGSTVTTNPDGSTVTTKPDGTTTTTPPTETNQETNQETNTETTQKPTPEPQKPSTTPTKKPIGQKAPAVTFYDGSGNAVTLEAFKDKPVVLCFWASWATASESTLNLLAEQYVNYSQDVYFVVVCITDGTKETRETADAFLADKSYPFPVYYDLDGVCHASYKVSTKPTTFFLKKDNLAYAYNKGALTKMILTTGIDYVLPPKES